MDVNKKQNFIVTVHTSARWVKLPELTFLTPALLMGGPARGRRNSRKIDYNI